MNLDNREVDPYAKDLSPYEVKDIPKHWKPRHGHQKIFIGRCFEMGHKYLMNHDGYGVEQKIDGMFLVHGVYKHKEAPDLVWASHCWVELPGDIIYDGSIGKFYKTGDYLRVTGAIPFKKYTVNEAATEFLKCPNDGRSWELGYAEKFHPGICLNNRQLQEVLQDGCSSEARSIRGDHCDN